MVTEAADCTSVKMEKNIAGFYGESLTPAGIIKGSSTVTVIN